MTPRKVGIGSAARRARWLVVVCLVASVTLVGGVSASSATHASRLRPASGADDGFEKRAARAVDALPGMWWYDALLVGKAHRQATGKGVTIALIDGPIDPTIPELRGQRVVPTRGYCDQSGRPEIAGGKVGFHTTSMAALMVGSGRGTGPGGTGIAGIAPDAAVHVYSVFDEVRFEQRNDLDSLHCRRAGAGLLEERVTQAIREAVAEETEIICIPLSMQPGENTDKAIRFAQRSGAVVVASAGNDGGEVSYPALQPGVVASGAVNRDARVWRESNQGDHAVVTAPGVHIASGEFIGRRWESTGTRSGTSASTALMAGALALVAEKYPAAAGWQLVRHVAYRSGADDKLDWSEEYGFGIVAVNRMLSSDPTGWRDSNPFADYGSHYFIGSEDDELTGPKPEDKAVLPGPDDGGSTPTTLENAVGPVALVGGGLILLGGLGALMWLLTVRYRGNTHLGARGERVRSGAQD